MLGKGLESLIPPSQGDGDNARQPAIPERSSDYSGYPKAAAAKTTPTDAFSAKGGSASGGKKPEDDHEPPAVRRLEPQDFVFHIEVSKVSPNPNQPRRNFDEAGIRDLANSIREFGFLQPLVVSRLEKETPHGVVVNYELIAGERRLLAAKMLGLEVVPAIIREVDLEREKLELAMVENIQRENLNPIETGRAFQRLQEEFRLTHREIASRIGKSRESVTNTMRLLDLPPYVQEALEKNQISESHGRLLLAVAHPGAQQKLFNDILSKGLTTREVKERVRRSSTPPSVEVSGEMSEQEDAAGESARSLTPELKMIEERLSSELGTPVKIEKGEKTGKITITFYSEEELENILRKIRGMGEKSDAGENFHL